MEHIRKIEEIIHKQRELGADPELMDELIYIIYLVSPDEVNILYDRYIRNCELPTHAKGDGMGFRSQHSE